jgi:hypothetical protein
MLSIASATTSLALNAMALGAYYQAHTFYNQEAYNNRDNTEPPANNKLVVEIHSGGAVWGHTSINIDGTVYNLSGDGNLIKVPEKDFYTPQGMVPNNIRLQRFLINYTPEQKQQIKKSYDAMFNSGTPVKNREKQTDRIRYIGYNAFSNNCTTFVTEPLPLIGGQEFFPPSLALTLNILSLNKNTKVKRLKDREPT